MNKLNADIEGIVNKNKDPHTAVKAEGGFFAKQVALMSASQEDYNKTTAENTKDIKDFTERITRELETPEADIIEI